MVNRSKCLLLVTMLSLCTAICYADEATAPLTSTDAAPIPPRPASVVAPTNQIQDPNAIPSKNIIPKVNKVPKPDPVPAPNKIPQPNAIPQTTTIINH
jgi:hypothetical protein